MSETPAHAHGRPRADAPAAGREIEAKYLVPDLSTFEKLLSLDILGEYQLVSRGEQTVTDRYYDTPERDLLRGGYVFRRRTSDGGGLEVVTVKGIGGARGALHQRNEHELQVPPHSTPEQWPIGPARNTVLELAGGRPLAELLTLSQRRAVRDVMRQDLRVAALSLDRIEFGADKPAAHELEVELAPPGNGADLRAFGKLLRPYGLRPQPLSKFQRALALLGGDGASARPAGARRPRKAAEPKSERVAPAAAETQPKRKSKRTGVLRGDSMTEAGRKILRFHFGQMLAHEAGTIEGTDPEELHDMRVATRRQRAALRIVEPHFRRKAIRPVRDGLRALGGCLGAVRDLDVLLAAARDYQSTLAAAEAGGFQELLGEWMRRREAARVEMLGHLGGSAYSEFKASYTRFLETPGAGARAQEADAPPRPTLVADVLRSDVWEHYGALCAFEPSLPWASAQTLHALRIEGKRLRYLLEFFSEVLDPCVDRAIEAIVALQDHLGELQDSVVTIGLIREFLAGPAAAANPAAAAAAGRYLESREARIEKLRSTLDRPWKGVSGPRFKSCLSRAVAAL